MVVNEIYDTGRKASLDHFEELYAMLAQTDLPRLWIPKRENFYMVDGIPQLGTGKLDLRGVRVRAQELAGVVA